MINALQMEAIQVGLKQMMRKGHFDICLIREILKITGGVPNGDDMRALTLLHCVDFQDFSPRLKSEFPALLRRVLEAPGMELEIKFKALERPPDLLSGVKLLKT